MVFLISEIGVNWDGDFSLLKEMMGKSKEIGFNAVKFQVFLPEMVQKHPECSRLVKSSISSENIEEVDRLSKEVGIEWFATPMYKEAINLLNPFVNKFKIREFDGREIVEGIATEIFEELKNTGKEIIISTQKSPKNSKFYNDPKIKWLYCVPKYPCAFEEIDFKNLNDFNGFSNHTPHFLAPLMANILGAEIIEIHITSDKTKNFIDNNVSFDYDEAKNLVTLINLSQKINKNRKE